MKVVILAGGFGTRLGQYTDQIPKPMVSVAGHPIIWHVMHCFYRYGFNDFYLALGYKADSIKEYFINYKQYRNNFCINLKTEKSGVLGQDSSEDWNVNLIDTGLNTMTGGRVKRLQQFIGNERFLLSYGDGIANVDLQSLIKFHDNSGKMITVTAVRPIARFGELDINQGNVSCFSEKPQISNGWINGGFFVVEPSFFDLIEDGDSTVLEGRPLQKAVEIGQLGAYQHDGFWHCMDTARDKEKLESLLLEGNLKWRK